MFRKKLKIWKTKQPNSNPKIEKGVKKYAERGKYLNGNGESEELYKLGKSSKTFQPA